MSPRYMQALVEVDYILNQLEVSEVKKIPQNFREFISKNKAKRYEVQSAENLSEEACAILAIIYRKFLASPEERVILEKEYEEKLKKEQAEMRKQTVGNININYDAKIPVSEDVAIEIIEEAKMMEITEYKEKKWYKKFFYKIQCIWNEKVLKR